MVAPSGAPTGEAAEAEAEAEAEASMRHPASSASWPG
jgi:hypothetical protein